MITSRWLKRGSMVRNFLEAHVVGRKRYQWLFQKLHLLSIAGLNYGEGSAVGSSGEDYVMRWFRDRSRGGVPVIFDVGANKGEYSLALLSLLKKECIIHAFEPSRETYRMFCRNVRDRRVKAHNFGFSNINGKIMLYSDSGGSGLASVYQRTTAASLNQTEEIELMRIDAFCRKQGISTIDFLKLDVEGHELKVLEGAGQLLYQKAIQVIQFEFGGCNVDSRTHFHDFWTLLNRDYHLYRILKDGLQPIEHYSLLDEIFVTVNFLAVLKQPQTQG